MVASAEVILVVHTQHRPIDETVVNDGVQYGLRKWSCTVQEGRPRYAAVPTQLPYVREVEFFLHETFPNRHRVSTRLPFRVDEQGWGEFDLEIVVHFVDCIDSFRIIHDLNFHEGEAYMKEYRFTIPNPSQRFLASFTKRTTAARKTLPAKGSKARKGPPRDSIYSKQQSLRRSPYSNDSLDGYHTPSADESASDSEHSDSDSPHSPTSPAKPRSVSSMSASSIRHPRANPNPKLKPSRPTDEPAAARPSVSHKHIPTTDDHAASLKHRVSATTAAANALSLKSERESAALSSSSRRANGVSSGSNGIIRPRRSPSDAHHPATANSPPSLTATAKARKQPSLARMPASNAPTASAISPTKPQIAERRIQPNGAVSNSGRAGVAEKSLSPVNRAADRANALPGNPASRRRLSDALENSTTTAKQQVRRRTLVAPDGRASSVSPPSSGADVRGLESNAMSLVSKRSLASGLASVKVPKKRDRDTVTEKDTDVVSAKIARSNVAANSREAFVRERERQRKLEQSQESGHSAAASAGSLRSLASKPAASSNTAANGLPKSMRSGNAPSRVGRVASSSISTSDDDQTDQWPGDAPKRKSVAARRDISDVPVPKLVQTKATDPGFAENRSKEPQLRSSLAAAGIINPKRANSAENKAVNRATDSFSTKTSLL
ncbi:transcription factor TFIIF complex subunit Tfg3 [Coemansia sp. Benny D115]|nr:transcription factor TFIIF complex subunit Tfg3 [Coemansia sp. Benny D115]